MTNNTAFLLIGIFALSIIMLYVLGRSDRKGRRWSIYLLCLSLLSIVCTISMGVNYLAAYTGKQDGIGLTGWLARLIIGEGSWSIGMFYSYYEVFTAVSIILVVLYFAAVLYENKRRSGY